MTRIALCLTFVAATVCSQTVLTQSLPNDWSHVWGSPYYTDDVPTPESAFGLVDQLNYVWWLEWFSPNITLPAGDYGCRVRLKKLTSTVGAATLTLSQNNSGGNQVDLLSAQQLVDTWVWTPILEFTVPPGGGTVAFRLHNTSGAQKQNYWFDSFEILQPDWTVNKPEASSDLNGVTSDGYEPARTSDCAGASVNLNFASTEVGQPWDFGYAFAPSIPGSATGIQTPGGQMLNVDIFDPSFTYYNGGNFNVPFPGNFSLPVTIPSNGTASMQSVHIAPAHPDGIALSQASQVDIVGGAPVVLSLGDDTAALVTLAGAPYCSPNPTVNFYGIAWTKFFVTSNGEVQFGNFAATSPVANATQFTTWIPRVAAMWTDLAPNMGGTVTVDATGADVKVSFASVPTSGSPGTASSADITFTGAGGLIIDNYLPDPSHALSTIIGISRGSSSTNPGPMGGTPAGTISALSGAGPQIGLPTDTIYEFATGGMPFGGWLSLEFPAADGSLFIVN